MKNLVFVLVLCLAVSHMQSQSFEGKGDAKVNIGFDVYGNGNGIKAAFDYGLSDLFSVGAGASFYFSNDENDYFLYLRTNVHLGIVMDLPPKFDIYPGAEIGYLSSNDIGLSGYLGLRYFFTDKIGIFTEIGNNGAIGLSINI
jgi:hypothetical protein